MRVFGRLSLSQSGGAAVEFAIVGTALMLVIFGIVEFGRGLNLHNQLSLAADYGARRILTDSLISDADIETEIRSAFTAPAPDSLSVALGSETVNGLSFRTVTLTYPFIPAVPALYEGTITLSVVRRTPLF